MWFMNGVYISGTALFGPIALSYRVVDGNSDFTGAGTLGHIVPRHGRWSNDALGDEWILDMHGDLDGDRTNDILTRRSITPLKVSSTTQALSRFVTGSSGPDTQPRYELYYQSNGQLWDIDPFGSVANEPLLIATLANVPHLSSHDLLTV